MAPKLLPLATGTYSISSGFRPPGRPNHNGVDFAANLGVPIYSVSDGFMAYIGINDDPNGYGSWLVVDSQAEWGLDFTYGHMHPSTFVNPRTGQSWKPGDRVFAGDKIAEVGNEGGSTGPHLHFETSGPPGRFGGSFIDPAVWLKDAVNPAEVIKPGEIISPSVGGLIGREVVDYAAGVPKASDVRTAGFVGAVRYVSPARPDAASWMRGKPLGRAESKDFLAHGLKIASNWQFGKRDFDRGFDGGVEDARNAERIHREAGGPATAPIYFSIDYNPAEDNSWDRVKAYLEGAQSVMGRDRMGVYGNQQTIQRCLDWGIGRWWWQHGWDGRPKDVPLTPHPAAHLLQFEIDKSSVGGVGIDRNRILKEQWGAWDEVYTDPKPEPKPEEPPVVVEPKPEPPKPTVNVRKPEGYRIVQYPEAGRTPRAGRTKGHGPYERSYLHTTENQDWITRAEAVADYQIRVQNGSYHFLIDDNPDSILQTVPLDDTAWGVLSDNPNSVQIAMVCTSGTIGQWSGANPNVESRPKTREQWLEHEVMLDKVAFTLAHVNKMKGIPLSRVDIAGVGRDEKGVSSHNNYTYGSVRLIGRKDGTHWDVPDTFPYDKVIPIANEYAKLLGGTPATPPPPPDPDAYPLRWDGVKECWGPLEGPANFISNRFGTESQASRDGLKRWQETVGIPGTGVYDAATKEAATKLQREKGWPPDPNWGHGLVWLGEWNAVIKEGWRLKKDTPPPAPPKHEKPIVPERIAPINPGPKVSRTKKIKDLTGPGHTTKFHMEATDLGVCTRTPSGRILAVFGDTFRFAKVGSEDWRAPVALFSDTKNLDEGLVWHEAAGGDPGYARQLWPYPHNNPEFSTVLPTDVITIGDTIYLHCMVNKGLGNVVWTEWHKSTDDGHTWSHGLGRIPGNWRNGLAQVWTMTQGPDGWVYVLSTSFRRKDPIILQRVRPEHIADYKQYEGWGWKPGTGWAWGNEPTPVLDRGDSGTAFGEMSLRYMQGQYVLVTFDAGGYDIDVRVFANITDNLYEAKKSTPIRGGQWGMEGDDRVAQLYGPSIIPGSTLDGGFHIVVSQWHTGAGWPYRSLQFKIPVDPVVPPTTSGNWVPPEQPKPRPDETVVIPPVPVGDTQSIPVVSTGDVPGTVDEAHTPPAGPPTTPASSEGKHRKKNCWDRTLEYFGFRR